MGRLGDLGGYKTRCTPAMLSGHLVPLGRRSADVTFYQSRTPKRVPHEQPNQLRAETRSGTQPRRGVKQVLDSDGPSVKLL